MEIDTTAIGRMIKKMDKAFYSLLVGVLDYTDGGKYDGAFKEDMKDGNGKKNLKIGIYIYPNGDRYDGNWSEDKKNGQGNHMNDV